MELGQLLRIVEILVTSYCGIQLAVRPCVMRWKNNVVQLIFVLLVCGWNVGLIWSLFFQKASVVEYFMTAIFYFIVEYVFFDIGFWKLFAQNFVYWIHLLLLREYTVYICGNFMHVSFSEYIYSDILWHWLHLLMIVLTILVVCILCISKKEKSFLQFRKKRHYVFFSIVLTMEYFLYENVIFDISYTKGIPSNNYIMFSGFCLLFWVSCGVILSITMSYFNIKYRTAAVIRDYELMTEQYQLIQKMYAEKKRKVHDSVQKYILIYEALQRNAVEDAIVYLEDCIQERGAFNVYTGISVIDFMMDYKINESKKWDIKVNNMLDVYFCPIKPIDMCVMLGNLFDNAIEAVKELEVEARKINIHMRTINNMFSMTMKNQYYGKRRIEDGNYKTTKKDALVHGIGLDSVKKIVEKYDGYIDIQDDGMMFLININIFKNMDTDRKELS